jgi:hypothetical protein
MDGVARDFTHQRALIVESHFSFAHSEVQLLVELCCEPSMMNIWSPSKELLRSIKAQAHRFPVSDADLQDLEAVGLEAAWKVSETGEIRESYMLGKSLWAMKTFLRNWRPGSRQYPADVKSLEQLSAPREHGGRNRQFYVQEPTPEENILQSEKQFYVSEMFKYLSLRFTGTKRGVILDLLRRGVKQRIIARELGISQARVSQLIKKMKVEAAEFLNQRPIL